VLAAVWAVARDGGSFLNACLVIGLFVGAFGVGSITFVPRRLNTAGRIPGMRTSQVDVTVRPGAIFAVAGVVLLVIGAFGQG
jgi:hypothetical protein